MIHPREKTELPVYALGVFLVTLSVAYLLFVGVRPLTLGKAGIALLLALPVFHSGRYLAGNNFSLRQTLRVSTWGVGMMLGAGWLATVILFILLADGVIVEDSLFIFLTSMSAGAAAGTAFGATKVELAEQRAEIERESEQISRLNKRLRVINRVLRHNFRNKLNVLTMWADSVYENPDRTYNSSDSENIQSTVQRLDELIEKTRNFEAVNQREETLLFDLSSLVEYRVSYLENNYPTVGYSLQTEDSVVVTAHRMLELAIDEVLENAVQHNDIDTLEIEVFLATDDRQEEAVLSIRDTGQGIPDQERAVIESGDETQLIHGSGMGLWLVQAIISESEGDVSIETNQPQGTQVVLRLPLADAPLAKTVNLNSEPNSPYVT